ncbi:polysaccharide pyruvyl transferase family protein [Henriciella sp.]|uniref:polysaccharide pyruvyl transferase family protein n=1 Tax=Henriciella sp. TaxID=1968823 RepID=UPI002617CB14|nr:polysaccharide pyruvyl transferase family protein [Henriciella sp.]
MKLVLLNVKYSPNLGDGIIAECLEAGLRASHPSVKVESCDIAGRKGYGQGINRSRELVFAVLDRLPKSVRRQVVAQILKRMIRKSLARHYAESLSGADAALIGGGQLIADADLNFPLKLDAAAYAAGEASVPVGVYGAGVGSHFTKAGLALFRSAFSAGLLCACVRDERSRARWDKDFAPPAASIVNDPGLLSCDTYPHEPRASAERPVIGLGLTNPSTLKLHADRESLDRRGWTRFFTTLCEDLLELGYDIQLFTNGAHDDHRFAGAVHDGLPDALKTSGHIRPAPALTEPRDLAALIAGLDGLIAHRLHANIIAYSYGIPHVGLGWDSKMEGFFGEVGRSDFLVSEARPKAGQVAERLQAAMQLGIDGEKRLSVIETTRTQVNELVSKLLETL